MAFGFGHGPFGRDPFGEANWSRWLYEALPELYLAEDEAQGFVLEKWQEALRGPLDIFRRKIRDYLDLRDPLRVRTQFDEATTIRLGPRILPTYPVEQRGVDGRIGSIREFTARSVRFKPQDIGKELKVWDSLIATNNVTVKISAFIDSYTVLTDPALSVDAGPLRWELRQAQPVNQEIITLEVRSGDVSVIVPGWRLFDGASEFEVSARRRFRNLYAERKLLTDREGTDGFIDSLGRFHSPTASLTQRDVGRPLSIAESAIPDNNKIFEIETVVSASIAELTVPALEDAGLFHWALYPFPLIELVGPAIPRGIVEQEGVALRAGAPNQLSSVEARFTARDIGKLITVRGSLLTNSGIYEIASLVNSNKVTVTVATLVNEINLTWELRTKTNLGDLTQVQAHAPSMIAYLAQDFGLQIDTQEVEKRQRAWVQHVIDWIDAKGHLSAYEEVAQITGFQVSLLALYGVDLSVVSLIPAANLYEIPDGSAGTSGTDGALQVGSGTRARLYSPTAVFLGRHVGRIIRISGTPADPNDHLYQIETVIDGNTVEFREVDVATLPDVRVLTWVMVDLFTDLPPLQPLFDEINVDLMVAQVGASAFHLDIYCWDANYSTDIPLTVTAITPISFNLWQVTVTGVANVVVKVGHWELEDSSFVVFRLETVPIGGGPWTFQVAATVAPALGAATLRYVCPELMRCGYCKSNRVLLSLVADDILNDTGVSLERIYERVRLRLIEEVKPHHVEFIEALQVNLTASLFEDPPVTVEQTIP